MEKRVLVGIIIGSIILVSGLGLGLYFFSDYLFTDGNADFKIVSVTLEDVDPYDFMLTYDIIIHVKINNTGEWGRGTLFVNQTRNGLHIYTFEKRISASAGEVFTISFDATFYANAANNVDAWIE